MVITRQTELSAITNYQNKMRPLSSSDGRMCLGIHQWSCLGLVQLWNQSTEFWTIQQRNRNGIYGRLDSEGRNRVSGPHGYRSSTVTRLGTRCQWVNERIQNTASVESQKESSVVMRWVYAAAQITTPIDELWDASRELVAIFGIYKLQKGCIGRKRWIPRSPVLKSKDVCYISSKLWERHHCWTHFIWNPRTVRGFISDLVYVDMHMIVERDR